MTEQQLADLERLENAAAAGPWTSYGMKITTGAMGNAWAMVNGLRSIAVDRSWALHPDDADFVAAARTAVPSLIASHREKDAEIAQLREQVLSHGEETAAIENVVSNQAAEIARLRARVAELETWHSIPTSATLPDTTWE